MKRTTLVVLLLIFCSLKPAAFSIVHDFNLARELAVDRCLIYCGLMILALEEPVHHEDLPMVVEQMPGHPRQLVQARKNEQKKKHMQKREHQHNNNNRVDRQRHAQINRNVNQPKQRNQKRLVKSFQRL